MRSTEIMHEIIEISNCKDSRQIMKLLKELRKKAVYEIIRELLKISISEIRLTDLPGKLYRKTYGTKTPEEQKVIITKQKFGVNAC